MPACVDKTPAHKRDISERIKFFEVSQGIQKANVLGEQTSAIGLALPGKLQAARLEYPFHLWKAVRMPRRQYHLKIGETLLQQSKGIQKDFLFATVRTPRYQQTPPIGFPFKMKGLHIRRVMSDVIAPARELQIAGDEHLCRIRSNPFGALGVFGGLHTHRAKISQHGSKKPGQERIFFNRSPRKTPTQEQRRSSSSIRQAKHIRPNFCL